MANSEISQGFSLMFFARYSSFCHSLNTSPEKLSRLLVCLTFSLLLYFAMPPFPTIQPNFVSFDWMAERFQVCLYLVIGSAALLTYLPNGWVSWLQTGSCFVLLFALHVDSRAWIPSLMMVATPVVLALVLWLLPLHRPNTRIGILILSNLLFLVITPTRLGSMDFSRYLVFSLSASLLCFQYSAVTLGERGGAKTFHEVFRPLLCLTSGPVSVEAATTRDRSLRNLILGFSWITMGISFHSIARWWHPDFASPSAIGLLKEGEVLYGLSLGLKTWLARILPYAGFYFLNCGMWRVLGMQVPVPMDRPWLSTNFLEYWRRTNTLRFKMYYRVYYQPLSTLRRPWLYGLVLGIFLLSALHHNHRGYSISLFVEWGLRGTLAVMTLWYLHARSAQKIHKYITLAQIPRKRPFIIQIVLNVASLLAVLTIHGILMQGEL